MRIQRDDFLQLNVSKRDLTGCFEDNRLGLALSGRRRDLGVNRDDDRDLSSRQFFYRIERQWGMRGHGWNTRNIERIQEGQMILFRHAVEPLNDKFAVPREYA